MVELSVRLPVASWVMIMVMLCPAAMFCMELAVMLPVKVMVWMDPLLMSMLAAKLPVTLPMAYTVSAKVAIFCLLVCNWPVPLAVIITLPLLSLVNAKPLANMLPARLPDNDPPPPAADMVMVSVAALPVMVMLVPAVSVSVSVLLVATMLVPLAAMVLKLFELLPLLTVVQDRFPVPLVVNT